LPKKKTSDESTTEIDSNYFEGSINRAKQFLVGKWQGEIAYVMTDIRGTGTIRKDLTYKFNADGSIIMKEIFHYPDDRIMQLPISYAYWNVKTVDGNMILVFHSESNDDVNGIDWSSEYLYKEMLSGSPDAIRFTATNKNEIQYGILSDPQTKEWIDVGTLKRVAD
jgi:hypothetical protein